MKKLFLFLSFYFIFSILNAQDIIEGINTTVSKNANLELETTKINYEYVDFPIEKLSKAITKKKNLVKIGLGISINDTWEIEENELLFDKLSINKWDEYGNPLPNKEYCETFLAKSKNQNLQIRFTIILKRNYLDLFMI